MPAALWNAWWDAAFMNDAPGTATAANGVVGHLTLFVAFVLCHEMTDALKKKKKNN